MRRPFIWMGVLAISVGVGGCSSDGDQDAGSELGEQVFADAGCGNCHTLAAAGTNATIGPNLDTLGPDLDTVAEQVRDGGPGMPAFEGQLTPEEIDAVALYVSDAAEGSSGAVPTAYEPDDTELAECEGLDDQPCYEQAFANVVYEDGPQAGLSLLEERLGTDDAITLNCHRIAHAMGSAALLRFNDDTGKAFAQGDAICSSGYYHGILERSFMGIETSELGDKARTLCGGGEVRSDPFLVFQCLHGLGHGLMIQTGYDLPIALDTCEELDGSEPTTCQDGVFMENFTSSYGVESEFLRDDDLIYPCNDVAEERKYSCYIIVTARILPEVNYNWRKAADVCRTSEPDWEWVCFRSFGRDAISMNSYDQDVARRLCTLTDEWETECVLSVALHIANEEGGFEGAARFCHETPERLVLYCYTGLGITASLIEPDLQKRADECNRITEDPEERIACTTGTYPETFTSIED